MMRCRWLLGLSLTLAPLALSGQAPSGVTFERVRAADAEPQNWLTYSGNYASTRHTALRQLTPANVKNLQPQWMYQNRVAGAWQATPLVIDGVLYTSQRPNDVVALDAKTGRVFWTYQYVPNPRHTACCGSNNRGLAILGHTLFMGTLDGQLIALDARTGAVIWSVEVGSFKDSLSITHAPLVIKDKVLVGVAGGDQGARGYVSAFDAKTGKQAWRFYTIPAPGEPGHETWEPCPPRSMTEGNDKYCDPQGWKRGGGPIWVTGAYDPGLNLTYWGVGNAGPDFNPDQRPGDNLYTASVIALDADTGTLKWHFQFTPNDGEDYDAVQVPVLADATWQGKPRKLMLWGNRNGFFYVLDRETGAFLRGKPFVRVNWASPELRGTGRPVKTPVPLGMPTYPGTQGGTNWFSPSYSPRTGLFYLQAWEDFASIRTSRYPLKQPEQRTNEGVVVGSFYTGGTYKNYAPVEGAPSTPALSRGPINNWTSEAGRGAILAIEPQTGAAKWRFEMTDVGSSGILTTASDLLFAGTRDGYFLALDARTGALLWRSNSLGGQIQSGPIAYEVDGRQHVAVIAGNVLVSFALSAETFNNR